MSLIENGPPTSETFSPIKSELSSPSNSMHTRANAIATERFQTNSDQVPNGCWNKIPIVSVIIAYVQNAIIRLIVFLSRRTIVPVTPPAEQIPQPTLNNHAPLLRPLAPPGEKTLSEAEQKEVVTRWDHAYKALIDKKAELTKIGNPTDLQACLKLQKIVAICLGDIDAIRFEYNELNATLNDILQNLLSDEIRALIEGSSSLVNDLSKACDIVRKAIPANQDNIHKHLEFRYKTLIDRVKSQARKETASKKEIEEKESKENVENNDITKLKEDCRGFFLDLHDLEGFECIKRDKLATYHRNLGFELQLFEVTQNKLNISRNTYEQLLEWAPPLKIDPDGLPNLHNTCYINSALQILHRSGMLTEMLRMNLIQHSQESADQLKKREEIKKILSLIVSEFEKGESNNPQVLKNLTNALYDFRRVFCDSCEDLSFRPDSYHGYSAQQDGPSFLRLLLQTFGIGFTSVTERSNAIEIASSTPETRGDIVISVPFKGDKYGQVNFTPWHLQNLIDEQFKPQTINDPFNPWRGHIEYTTRIKITAIDSQGQSIQPPKYLPIALNRTQQMNASERVTYVTAMKAEALTMQMCRASDITGQDLDTYLEYFGMAEQRLGFSPLDVSANICIAKKMREIAQAWEKNLLGGLREKAEQELKEKSTKQQIQLSGSLLRIENFARLRSEAMQQLKIAGNRKVLDPIICPLGQNIDCRAIFGAEQPLYYRVFGFQVHHGLTPSGGHYTAVARHHGNWTHFNDNIVAQKSAEQAEIMATGDSRTMHGNPDIDSSDASADYLILERVDFEEDAKERSEQA